MDGFFGINGGEMVMLFVIALVVVGPQRLPKLARRIGEISREIRAVALDFRQGIEREVAAIEEPLKELKDDIAGPLGEIRDDLKSAQDDISKPLSGIGDDLKSTGQDLRSGLTWSGPVTERGPKPSDAADDLHRIEAGEDLLDESDG